MNGLNINSFDRGSFAQDFFKLMNGNKEQVDSHSSEKGSFLPSSPIQTTLRNFEHLLKEGSSQDSSTNPKENDSKPTEKSNSKTSSLEANIAKAERLYGKWSAAGLAAEGKLSAQSSKVNLLQPSEQKMESQEEAPQKSGGFFGFLKKFVGVFSKIMKFASPFLSFIPVVGQAISGGWSLLKGIAQIAKGNISGFIKEIASGALNLIPGGGVLSKVGDLFSKALPFLSKIASPLTDVLGSIKGFLPLISQLTPLIEKVSPKAAAILSQISSVPEVNSEKEKFPFTPIFEEQA